MKIPIPFTEKLNADTTNEHRPTKFRWVFDLSGKQGEMDFSIGFDREYFSRGSWHRGGGYYNVIGNAYNPTWGRSHGYYDGPHDSFSLGYIHFCWQGDWCDKCWGEEET